MIVSQVFSLLTFQVETMSANTGVTIPIAVLKVGETRSLMTNLEFPEAPVCFKLVEGNGPVYIHGNSVPVYLEQVDEAEDEVEVIVSKNSFD